MDNTQSITDILPTLDGGRLVKISFSACVSDELGNTAAETITEAYGLPDAADVDAGYTDEELHAICYAIAAQHNVYTHLDTLVTAKRTPVFSPVPPPVLSDDDKRAIWMTQIDVNVASVYAQFTRFQTEYEQREKAAQAYKDAGYTGDPTIWLTAFADSVGISYQTCADLVLSQAAQLRGAVVKLGELRMSKYKVKNAETIEEAEAEFNVIISGIATLARSLQ